MTREIRLFLLGVGLPAIVLAAAGLRLVQLEYRRAHWAKARQEQRAKFEAARKEAHKDSGREAGAEPSRRRGDASARGGQRRGMRGPEGGAPRPLPRHLMRVFGEHPDEHEQESVSSERTIWLGGCLLGLAFLSLVAGGWLLARAARRAREDSLRKTDFLSNVSHEFKTPLTTICLCSELAQDEGLSPERRQKALRSISAEAERLKGLVLNALDFSRLEKGRREFNNCECDVAKLAREAGEPMDVRFPRGLSLPEGTCAAKSDPSALKQILAILLDNAAKYAADGGLVEVTAEAPASSHGKVLVKVADRGPGLDAYGRRHAFDRFWRGDDATTAETGGAGLGLAIAKRLAEGMGGRLSVSPRDGGGLVFVLALAR